MSSPKFVTVLHVRLSPEERDLLLEVERLGRATAGSTRSGLARVALAEGLRSIRARLTEGR